MTLVYFRSGGYNITIFRSLINPREDKTSQSAVLYLSTPNAFPIIINTHFICPLLSYQLHEDMFCLRCDYSSLILPFRAKIDVSKHSGSIRKKKKIVVGFQADFCFVLFLVLTGGQIL